MSAEREAIPDTLPCPLCMFHEPPDFWLCRRVSARDNADTYTLHGCHHAKEVGDWNFPPQGMSTSRAALARAWNEWVGENTPQSAST